MDRKEKIIESMIEVRQSINKLGHLFQDHSSLISDPVLLLDERFENLEKLLGGPWKPKSQKK